MPVRDRAGSCSMPSLDGDGLHQQDLSVDRFERRRTAVLPPAGDGFDPVARTLCARLSTLLLRMTDTDHSDAGCPGRYAGPSGTMTALSPCRSRDASLVRRSRSYALEELRCV